MDRNSRLENIRIDLIKPNPENPRMNFRQEEMDSLLVSIKKHGVQVPISVYREGNHFRIIDGERRWRTCLKLNFEKIPAIIQDKLAPLENLLMMFNIHALREQWDLFTIAKSLTSIVDLFKEKHGYNPTEAALSEETGLTRSTIRRCKLIIELPEKYKEIIAEELQKPKAKQKLTEDFFIEMEKSLKTVRNNFPQTIENINDVRDTLIKKYQTEVIKNILDFRNIAKLATSPKNVGYSAADAAAALLRIFSNNSHSIEDVFNSTVNPLYSEKKLITNFNSFLTHITSLNETEKSDDEIIEALIGIRNAIDEILKD